MYEQFEYIMYRARLIKTYVFRKLFKGEAQLIDRLMEDNKELTQIASEQVQTIFDKESRVQTLEYQLEDAEVKIELLENKLADTEFEHAEVVRDYEWRLDNLNDTLTDREDLIESLYDRISEMERGDF